MGVPKVLADLRILVGNIEPERPAVRILAFEAAAAMSSLVSLHSSVADNEVRRLRNDMRAPGVAYLTSKDQAFLLRLACAELVDELDRAAAAVSRLGARCSDPLLRSFDRLYADLKAGGISATLRRGQAAELERLGLGATKTVMEKRVRKMEKYVAATSRLYAEMEVLNELEATERRMELQLQQQSCPIPAQKQAARPPTVLLELRSQRQKVRRLKEESLWNKTFDKVVDLMVRAVITVFSRICAVFGPHVLGLPPLPDRNHRNPILRSSLELVGKHSSGPMGRPAVMDVSILRSSAPMFTAKESVENPFERLKTLLEAGPSTVGGSGLAQRYANVIVLAERLLTREAAAEAEAEEEEAAAREELYQMMPARMRGAVRAKLREWWRQEGGTAVDVSLAEGWRQAVARILSWLGPVAHDTLRWQEERNMERQQRFYTRPRALLMQTLNFADSEKTEAAAVEVLVGLSCVRWYEDRRRDDDEEFISFQFPLQNSKF